LKAIFFNKSYLSNRCQRVIIKDAIFSVGELKAGVPQGSVLGPSLFLIFINDIADDMLGLGRLFTDMSIGHTAHDETTLKNKIDINCFEALSIMVLICLVHLQSQLKITPSCLRVFTV
jgi:hypothetical protein